MLSPTSSTVYLNTTLPLTPSLCAKLSIPDAPARRSPPPPDHRAVMHRNRGRWFQASRMGGVI
eukprot:758254-Hanusia_phi.AAC.2